MAELIQSMCRMRDALQDISLLMQDHLFDADQTARAEVKQLSQDIFKNAQQKR